MDDDDDDERLLELDVEEPVLVLLDDEDVAVELEELELTDPQEVTPLLM